VVYRLLAINSVVYYMMAGRLVKDVGAAAGPVVLPRPEAALLLARQGELN